MAVDYPPHLVRPDGETLAKWLGRIGDTGKIHIRYWQLDPKTGRREQVTATAILCTVHYIFYLAEDYPKGCPRCGKVEIVKEEVFVKEEA